MSRMVSRPRIAPVAAVVLGLLTLAMGALDLDAVRNDLVGVVERAFQPTQVSVWLALADGQGAGVGLLEAGS